MPRVKIGDIEIERKGKVVIIPDGCPLLELEEEELEDLLKDYVVVEVPGGHPPVRCMTKDGAVCDFFQRLVAAERSGQGEIECVFEPANPRQEEIPMRRRPSGIPVKR